MGKTFFWECRPVTKAKVATLDYEFVMIHAPDMNLKATDGNAFDDKFEKDKGTMAFIQFMTPSPPPKETNLMAPARAPGKDKDSPPTPLEVYRSISSFFRGAPTEQKHNMLKLLGSHMPVRLSQLKDGNRPLWCSTAGYDVAWLHLRLD